MRSQRLNAKRSSSLRSAGPVPQPRALRTRDPFAGAARGLAPQRLHPQFAFSRMPVVHPVDAAEVAVRAGSNLLGPALPALPSETVIGAGRPGGAELPAGLAAAGAPHVGSGLPPVRVHDDEGAHALAASAGAAALTVGANILFAQRRFEMTTPVGRRLLAH